MNSSFITPCERICHIKALEKYLDIEYSTDFTHIIGSGKPALVWNHYAFKVPGFEHLKIRHDVWEFYKHNNLEIYCVERGGLPNTVYFDHNGLCTESFSYRQWKDHTIDDEIDDYLNHLKSSEESLELQSISRQDTKYLKDKFHEKYDKIIFVPLQVKNDTTIITGSRISIYNFMRFILWISYYNPRWLFLMKSHPLDNIQWKETHNVRHAEGYHYKDCIEMSDCIACINSGVGLQALAWNKPVFTFGDAYYSEFTCKTSVTTFEADVKKGFDPDFQNIRKFFSFLMYQFYTECNNKTHEFQLPIRFN